MDSYLKQSKVKLSSLWTWCTLLKHERRILNGRYQRLETGIISILIALDYQIVVWVVLISVGRSRLVELNVVVIYEIPCKRITSLFKIFQRICSVKFRLRKRLITKTAVNLFLKPIPSLWKWWFRISFEPKWRHSFFNFFPVRSKMINTSHQSQIFFSTE